MKSGLILADLRATPNGSLYGDTIWRFSLTPRPATKAATSLAAAASESAKGSASAGKTVSQLNSSSSVTPLTTRSSQLTTCVNLKTYTTTTWTLHN